MGGDNTARLNASLGMKHLALPENIRDLLVKYLAQRPWQEVAQIMPILTALPEVPGSDKENTDP